MSGGFYEVIGEETRSSRRRLLEEFDGGRSVLKGRVRYFRVEARPSSIETLGDFQRALSPLAGDCSGRVPSARVAWGTSW